MTVNRTTLLDLPLPVTGTESGTWGDTTNNGLSQYMDIAIAGMNSLTSANFTAGALTLANTLGDSSATNIAAGSAQYATIRVSSLAVNSTITAPGSNRSYRIINADSTYSLTIKASGQTGVTFLPGQTGVVAFNGTDYVIVGVVGAGTATDNAIVRFDGTTGKLVQNSVVTIADSTGDISGVGQLNATTVDATNIEVTNIKAKDGTAAASIADSTGVISITSNPVLSGGTANGVLYLNGSKVATSGSALVFDGSNLGLGVTPSAWGSAYRSLDIGGASFAGISSISYTLLNAYLDSSGVWTYKATAAASGYLQTAGQHIWYTAPSGTAGNAITFSQVMTLDASGNLGIGTSSPVGRLRVKASAATFASGLSIQRFDTADTYEWVIGSDNALYLGYATSASGADAAGDFTSRLVLDSSGNLGLGVTPSAWTTGWKAFQIASTSSLTDFSGQSSYWNNCVVTGATTPTYQTTAAASFYRQTSGQHLWYTAASGTAGNAITFTQAMTLDASGGLQIGRTSVIGTNNRLAIQMSGTSASSYTAASNAALAIDAGTATNCVLNLVGGGDMGIFRSNSSNAYDVGISFGDNSNRILSFTTANTERARITSGGLVQVSSGGSVQIGDTAARATTAGTNRLDIFNGTAPVGTLSNGISIYSSSGEAYVMDAAGNATLFSPHDAETNEWIFKSKHTPTGKTLKIDVEKLLRFINDHFGLDAVHEFIEP